MQLHFPWCYCPSERGLLLLFPLAKPVIAWKRAPRDAESQCTNACVEDCSRDLNGRIFLTDFRTRYFQRTGSRAESQSGKENKIIRALSLSIYANSPASARIIAPPEKTVAAEFCHHLGINSDARIPSAVTIEPLLSRPQLLIVPSDLAQDTFKTRPTAPPFVPFRRFSLFIPDDECCAWWAGRALTSATYSWEERRTSFAARARASISMRRKGVIAFVALRKLSRPIADVRVKLSWDAWNESPGASDRKREVDHRKLVDESTLTARQMITFLIERTFSAPN